ncbi:MAG: Asp23/Gls24 family envelope stress response protein, partial [Streptomyces sp.]
VRIRVEVQVPFTWNLPEAADRVRHRVIEAVDEQLGMPVAVVDVTISDLVDDGDGDHSDDSTEGRQR